MNKNKGTVKFFNSEKGFGFIKPDDGGADVFVHISAVKDCHYDTLEDGANVEFDVCTGDNGRTHAENINILN